MIYKCRITTPGGWLDLMTDPFKLSAEAFVESSLTWRKQEANNPFVDGTWVVNATKENITSVVDVYVRGETTAETTASLKALRDAFGQLNYGIEFTIDDVVYYYRCYVADYTIKTPREFRFSTMAQFSAQVPHDPNYEIREVVS
jgi:hypothetical protein